MKTFINFGQRIIVLILLASFLPANLAEARYYSSKNGRFLQRDPLGQVPDPNVYKYVYNNPTNFVDPSGLDAIVLNAEGEAYGFGHNAIAIGNESVGWDYYSQDGSGHGPASHHYNTYEQMMSALNYRYTRSHRVVSNSHQDQVMRNVAQNNLGAPYNVNILSPKRYHCGDLVSDTLQAGGIPIGTEPFGNRPNYAFDEIRRRNNRANYGGYYV